MDDFYSINEKYKKIINDKSVTDYDTIKEEFEKDIIRLNKDEKQTLTTIIKTIIKKRETGKVDVSEEYMFNKKPSVFSKKAMNDRPSVINVIGSSVINPGLINVIGPSVINPGLINVIGPVKIVETVKKPYIKYEHHVHENAANMYKAIVFKDLPKGITEGEFLSSKGEAKILKKITEEEFEKRCKQFEKLKNIILPEQRSPEWFKMRDEKITASDCGTVLDENKHELQYKFIMNKVFGKKFETNINCYHGKKFENVVTLVYELLNDVSVHEFGLLSHPKYDFLGASPDGICSSLKLDKKTNSPLVGRMLEIKCPRLRKIQYTGEIKGNICPDYYWCQVQLQLECCDLEECDFVQCMIEEFTCREEYIKDTSNACPYKTKKYGLEKGVVIELLPTILEKTDFDENGKVSENTIYDKTTHLYQPKLNMSLEEVDEWIINSIENIDSKKRLHKIIYWRFTERNTTLIIRDKIWFKTNLSKMKNIWDYVKILRVNTDLANEWKMWTETQKLNSVVMQKLNDVITNYKNSIIVQDVDLVKVKKIKTKKELKPEQEPEQEPEPEPKREPEPEPKQVPKLEKVKKVKTKKDVIKSIEPELKPEKVKKVKAKKGVEEGLKLKTESKAPIDKYDSRIDVNIIIDTDTE